ncbi:hypothetical protein STENM223S_05582 [Streptomyces tendae]
MPPQAVLTGERGAPRWPDGLTGSMTHCDAYCAAALVRLTDLASLGIDAEPDGPLPDGVLKSIALPAEVARLRGLDEARPGLHWDRLLFSAKESVYKAWFPLTGKWLDFSEADIEISVDPADARRGTLRAALLVAGPTVGGRRLTHFAGQWSARNGLVTTAMAAAHPTASRARLPVREAGHQSRSRRKNASSFPVRPAASRACAASASTEGGTTGGRGAPPGPGPVSKPARTVCSSRK